MESLRRATLMLPSLRRMDLCRELQTQRHPRTVELAEAFDVPATVSASVPCLVSRLPGLDKKLPMDFNSVAILSERFVCKAHTRELVTHPTSAQETRSRARTVGGGGELTHGGRRATG